MSMFFISIFIIPSMEMYAVPSSIELNLELSSISDLPKSKEIGTNYSPVNEELSHEMSDATIMNKSEKMEHEHASSMSNFSCEFFIAGIFMGIFFGFVCHRILMICAISEADQSIIGKVILGLLLIIVIFSLILICCTVMFIIHLMHCQVESLNC